MVRRHRLILLDFSQIVLANISVLVARNEVLEEKMLRHMILNSIRSNRKKFKDKYGEMVICCDGANIWRKKVFPYYKANRKKSREASKMDWKYIFEVLDKVRDEIKEHMPYAVVRVEGAEGDDVIATLASEWSIEGINNLNNILIVSGDKDFVQLQKFKNVDQFDPVNKKFVKSFNPERSLRELVIRGDVGDGVPNFLSQDNSLAMGIRQKPIVSKKLAEWLDNDPETFCDEDMLRNFRRNEMMIDLSKTPSEIKTAILQEYSSQTGKNRSKVLKYFVNNSLSNLMDVISEF